jgi:hypothetical protein
VCCLPRNLPPLPPAPLLLLLLLLSASGYAPWPPDTALPTLCLQETCITHKANLMIEIGQQTHTGHHMIAMPVI